MTELLVAGLTILPAVSIGFCVLYMHVARLWLEHQLSEALICVGSGGALVRCMEMHRQKVSSIPFFSIVTFNVFDRANTIVGSAVLSVPGGYSLKTNLVVDKQKLVSSHQIRIPHEAQ